MLLMLLMSASESDEEAELIVWPVERRWRGNDGGGGGGAGCEGVGEDAACAEGEEEPAEE